MAAAVAAFVSCFSPALHRKTRPFTLTSTQRCSVRASVTSSVQSAPPETTSSSVNSTSHNSSAAAESIEKVRGDSDSEQDHTLNLRDYLDRSIELIRSSSHGGPPRWFSPLECGSRREGSPLLLFLPGVDGVGHGLTLQYEELGKIFDIWCLHIPVMDRTSFTDLVMFVEDTVRLENQKNPKRSIYLLGESFGGCLALAVAARNQDIDLLLIVANPATCFHRSQVQSLIPLSEIMPQQLRAGLPYIISLMTGIPASIVKVVAEKRLPLQQSIEQLSQDLLAVSYYLSVLADVLSAETILWKLKMLKSAAEYANSRLHAIEAQTLILCSGKDQLLPSVEEGERLRRLLLKCQIRTFSEKGHVLFLEHGFDLVTIIKGSGFYRRGRSIDYVSDYLPPSASEFKRVYEPFRWLEVAVNPVMLSTLENGDIIRGLAGVPSEGPVLFVGYHMMLGFELIPLVSRFLIERQILVRGIAHPLMFSRERDGKLPDLSAYDTHRLMGAVPVSASNFFKLFSSKSHVLLYPGGMREALHKKGEEYQLFWPEQSEFIRMAARFGAKIIPFGVVGEDDIGQLLLDYDDLMKVPYFRAGIEELTNEAVKLRSDIEGEVANQHVHLPIIAPKLPGRFYFLFGKPIETKGRKQELKSKEKAQELYVEVKSEVERCLSFLKEKREKDPYRNLLARLLYQATHGFNCEVPTFDL